MYYKNIPGTREISLKEIGRDEVIENPAFWQEIDGFSTVLLGRILDSDREEYVPYLLIDFWNKPLGTATTVEFYDVSDVSIKARCDYTEIGRVEISTEGNKRYFFSEKITFGFAKMHSTEDGLWMPVSGSYIPDKFF